MGNSKNTKSTLDEPIQSSLAEIKGLLEQQNKTMSAQSQEISKLTAEVDPLRSKMGEWDDHCYVELEGKDELENGDFF